jgi:SRSO17 transposase
MNVVTNNARHAAGPWRKDPMLPKISSQPGCCKRFFNSIRPSLIAEHFAHFWRIVVLLAVLDGRRNLSAMTEATGRRRTRQAISHFLDQDTWDAAGLLRNKAMDTLRELGWRRGHTVYALIDDTQKRKRAKRMAAVQKLFLHAEKVYAPGHTIVSCVLVYRGVVIPYALSLWAPAAYCLGAARRGEPPLVFRKSTELAAEMIAGLTLPSEGKAIVMFDSFYLCPAVLAACKSRDFAWISIAKKNRTFSPGGRDRRKLSSYGRNMLRRNGRSVSVGAKKYRLAERWGRLSRAGEVKLVFSRRGRERSWVALATNQRQWSAKTIVSHYLKRWGIEVFFKMSKQHLGLGDYQVLGYRAVQQHLRLVFIAYLLLTHLALQAPDVKAKLKDSHSVLRLRSIPKLQQELRATLWEEAVHDLENSTTQRGFLRKIKGLFRRAA